MMSASFLHKIIYRYGIKFRNPTLSQHLDFLRESDKWDIEKLQNYQLQEVKNLLIFAYRNSPYYEKLFNKIKFDPKALEKITDLSKIPIIEKSDLIKYSRDIQSKATFKILRFSESSGTTGQPLGIYRSEEWDSKVRAAMFRGYGWYGVNPWGKNGYLWGYNINSKAARKIRILDTLQNRFRLFSYNEEEVLQFLKKLRNSSFLSGYSSMVYEISKEINRYGMSGQFSKIRMVKGTGEVIYPSYQEEVEKAFGMKMISEYGSMETGLIAFECPEGGRMHIAMENVIVEEVDGMIVVTNLLSHSFPIIRYKLGDFIKLSDPDFRCECGRNHPVISDVEGRIGKNIIGHQKQYPSLTFYYVFKNLVFEKNINLNYQAIQKEKGKVLLLIEQEHDIKYLALHDELKKYFGIDVDFEIRWGQSIQTFEGKKKDFITTLN